MKSFGTIYLLLSVLVQASPLALRGDPREDLRTAYSELQQWYQQDSGLWLTAEWWQNANIVSMLCDFAELDENYAEDIVSIVENTYNRAPSAHQAFLNDFYDDEGWWALAWIAAYDLIGDRKYLNTAESIFADMLTAFGQTSCSTTGGIWWDKAHTYVNTIANELFMAVAASLSNRVNGDSYHDLAVQQWNWLQSTGLQDNTRLWNDGLDDDCQNNGSTITWTYNQGVIVGALVELAQATGDPNHLTRAQGTADAALARLTQNGILKEPCEADNTCNADRSQFKGIFMRNLKLLQQATGSSEYQEAIIRNGESIRTTDKSGNQLGLQWDGPFVSPATASTHSSAMDCLVAAWAA